MKFYKLGLMKNGFYTIKNFLLLSKIQMLFTHHRRKHTEKYNTCIFKEQGEPIKYN